MLQKVVIANRGVVAMRIARTLRRLGVPYAVVYSEADAGLPYVREATEAAPIGEARPQIQLRLARGERLRTILPAAPEPDGHAIEARIYAEDSVRFLPSPGPLRVFRPPSARPGLSMDVGYAEGDVVTPFYDPMLALVIAHGRDRNSAIARLDAALADFAVDGVKTNIPFLRSMLASEAFDEGGHHTTFAEGFASRPKTGVSSVGAT